MKQQNQEMFFTGSNLTQLQKQLKANKVKQ